MLAKAHGPGTLNYGRSWINFNLILISDILSNGFCFTHFQGSLSSICALKNADNVIKDSCLPTAKIKACVSSIITSIWEISLILPRLFSHHQTMPFQEKDTPHLENDILHFLVRQYFKFFIWCKFIFCPTRKNYLSHGQHFSNYRTSSTVHKAGWKKSHFKGHLRSTVFLRGQNHLILSTGNCCGLAV